MTARITGFVTRAEAGLRSPKSVSKNITPGDGGVAFHYGGPASNAKGHADCVTQWRGWQNFHMGTRGWSDIAYTMGVCQHGYVFAGRGVGVRTAANGTNSGNQSFYAVCWLGGDGQTPTQEALDAFEWAVLTLRKAGAGRRVRPHRSFKSTSCPGDPLVAHAARLDNKDVSEPKPPTPSEPSKPAPQSQYRYPLPPGRPVFGRGSTGDKVKAVQERLHIEVDGDWGDATNHAFRAFQTGMRIAVDGVYGNDARNAFIKKGRG